jgi:hypothetical protein
MLNRWIGEDVRIYEALPTPLSRGKIASRVYEGRLVSVEKNLISVLIRNFAVNNTEIPEATCIGREMVFNTTALTFSEITTI